MRDAWARRFDELCGEKGCRFICQAKRGAVCNLFQLSLNPAVNLRVVVPVEICPNRGVRVQVFPPMNVAQESPATFHDDDRVALKPILHLRERMPHIAKVKFGELVHFYKTGNSAIQGFSAAINWSI